MWAPGSPGGRTRRFGTYRTNRDYRRVPPLKRRWSNAALAQSDEVESVVLELEAGLLGDLGEGLVDRTFQSRRDREVTDGAAGGADQVVMVLGEVFGQLVAGPLIGRHDLLDH